MRRTVGRPRKRPPLRSYVPFFLAVLTLLVVLIGIGWLVASLVRPGTPAAHRAPQVQPSATAHAAVVQATSVPHTAGTQTATTVADTVTPVRSAMPAVPITPGGPLPTRTPIPTSTATGGAGLVVARDVDASTGKPVEQAVRFISPALRLYAIATVHHVHSSDVLRFVFQRNGVTLAHDDIPYTAGTDALVQDFSAYADYQGGAKPLPHGQYHVLFYRNGRLEAETTFLVG